MPELRAEEEIVASWKEDLDNPAVSICCLTYNHEKYIEEAIRGFLNQETDFPFEIIIHDDASTDRTREIISKFSNAYPKIIKTILQEANQYSQGINPVFEVMLPSAKGQYVALCEGDDYWCSRSKLKKQYEALNETNLNVAFNLSVVLDDRTKKFKLNINPATKLSKSEIVQYTFRDVAKGGASLMRTGSLFLRKACIDKFPKVLVNTPAPDIFLQLFCALDGAVCVNSVMTVYRTNVQNSWSSRNLRSIKKFRDVTTKMLVGYTHISQFISNDKSKNESANSIKYRFIYQYYRMALISIIKHQRFDQLGLRLKFSDYRRALFWAVGHQLDRAFWRFKVKVAGNTVRYFENV